MISSRDFKAKFEQLPQTGEEVVLKKHYLGIFGSSMSTNMGARVHRNSSLHKPCSQHGQRKDHTFLDDSLVFLTKTTGST